MATKVSILKTNKETKLVVRSDVKTADLQLVRQFHPEVFETRNDKDQIVYLVGLHATAACASANGFTIPMDGTTVNFEVTPTVDKRMIKMVGKQLQEKLEAIEARTKEIVDGLEAVTLAEV